MTDASLPATVPAIKAIETSYAGHRFRSRLEARWAVFFDALGWSWKYEHEGYEIGLFDKLRWLPDFEITVGGQDFYVEVKGDPDFFADGTWLDYFDYGSGPPGFAHSLKRKSGDKPLLILGALPREKSGRLFVPVISHYKGIVMAWESVSSTGINLDLGEIECLGNPAALTDFQPVLVSRPGVDRNVLFALAKARSARFEHGEKP